MGQLWSLSPLYHLVGVRQGQPGEPFRFVNQVARDEQIADWARPARSKL
jgi:hypothetical protein